MGHVLTCVTLLSLASGVAPVTLLATSERPAACRPEAAERNLRESGDEAWLGVKLRLTRSLCQELSRVQVQLATEPAKALAAATELRARWPERVEPVVLEARARRRLGDVESAWPLWRDALARGQELSSPGLLRDYALTASLSGHVDAALDAYRRLVTLAALVPSGVERRRLYVEAAAVALRKGPEHLAEAGSYLAEARRGASSVRLRALVMGMLALSRFHAGEPDPVLGGYDPAEAWLLDRRVRGEEVPPAWPEVGASAWGAASLTIEGASQTQALELWQAYVTKLQAEDPSSPWLARARVRLSRLEAGGP